MEDKHLIVLFQTTTTGKAFKRREAERALKALLSCKTEHNRDMAILPDHCSREMIEKIYEGYE